METPQLMLAYAISAFVAFGKGSKDYSKGDSKTIVPVSKLEPKIKAHKYCFAIEVFSFAT